MTYIACFEQVAVLPNLRLWTIQLWMTDSEMDVLKSSDRLKQEVDKEQGLTLFKFQQTAFIMVYMDYTIIKECDNCRCCVWLTSIRAVAATHKTMVLIVLRYRQFGSVVR